MDRIKIGGGRPLQGTVRISGAKNAALPAMAAALLTAGKHTFTSVPDLADIRTMQKLLTRMGADCHFDESRRVMEVDAARLSTQEAPYDLVRTMRASVLVLGPLVGRFGRAKVSLPGGCSIGTRPVDFHIEGLKKLGVEVNLSGGYIHAETRKLKGSRIVFPVSSVTGTENLLMAAVMADGETILENAAQEPEVVELARLLRAEGAVLEGEGTSRIRVQGPAELSPVDWTIIPDRIETGTFALAAVMTGGDLMIENAVPAHCSALLEKVREAGGEVIEGPHGLRVKGRGRPNSVDITTAPFPGFATDMQAQFMAWMCLGTGSSVVTEGVFQQRFIHVSELRRMGANISLEGAHAVVKGGPRLVGAEVMATDLRASACLVLAGLAAEGTTMLHRVYHLDRGYERIEEKLKGVGAAIDRLK